MLLWVCKKYNSCVKMPSIQSQVSKLLTNEPGLSLKDIGILIPKAKPSTLNSCYTRHKNNAKDNALDALNTDPTISMDLMEKLLMKQLKKKPDIPTLRLMVDFLKLKSQDHSELQEIDLEIFYKKAMMD